MARQRDNIFSDIRKGIQAFMFVARNFRFIGDMAEQHGKNIRSGQSLGEFLRDDRISEKFRDAVKVSVESALRTQPAPEAEKERAIAEARVSVDNGRISFFQRVKRLFCRSSENQDITKTTAQLADISDQRFAAKTIGGFMARKDIDFDLAKPSLSAREVCEQFEERLSRSRSGQKLYREFREELDQRLAEGQDGLKIEKTVTVMPKDGKVCVLEYETVESPHLPKSAPELVRDAKPSGLKRDVEEKLMEISASEVKRGVVEDAPPVRADVFSSARYFTPRGEMKLTDIIDQHISGNVSTSCISYHDYTYEEAVKLKEEHPGVYEHEKQIEEIKFRFSLAAERCLKDLGVTLDDQRHIASPIRSYSGTSTYCDSENGIFQSMDVRTVQSEIPFANLGMARNMARGEGKSDTVSMLENIFYEYNGSLLAKEEGYSFNPDTLECSYKGVVMEKRNGSFEYPKDGPEEPPFSITLAMDMKSTADIPVTIGFDAYCNNTYGTSQSFATATRISLPIPDEMRGTKAFGKFLDMAGDKRNRNVEFRDGCICLRNISFVREQLPSAKMVDREMEGALQRVFMHDRYASHVNAENERMREAAAAEIRAEKAERAKVNYPGLKAGA